MEESTRRLKVDLRSFINTETCYITTHQIFEEFSIANTPDNLLLALHNPDPRNKKDPELDFVDTDEMVSEQAKVLIYVQDTVYHFFIDSLALILKIHREHPGTKFVLYLQKARSTQSINNFYELLFLILDGEGVDYKAIPTITGKDYAPVYRFNNYARIDRRVHIHNLISFVDVEHMADLALKYSRQYMNVTDKVEPFRKLYISRGNAPSSLGPVADDYLDYKDDIRMNDAWKVEEFFISMGYDAFSPEKYFGSIMEQIVYMNEVKTLASITSSGLSNMIFMQPNQTIIEMQSELVQVMRFDDDEVVYPTQKLHNFYSTLSFMREHTHISIPSRRDPDRVIKTLSEGLLSYIL